MHEVLATMAAPASAELVLWMELATFFDNLQQDFCRINSSMAGHQQ